MSNLRASVADFHTYAICVVLAMLHTDGRSLVTCVSRRVLESHHNCSPQSHHCDGGGDVCRRWCRSCPKAYHLSCIGRDAAFFKKKGAWLCGECR